MRILPIRSDFSLGESALKVEDGVRLAKERGYGAVMTCDTMGIQSIIQAQETAVEVGIEVICGVRLNIVDDPTYEARKRELKKDETIDEPIRDRSYSFIALIKNDNGFKDICQLLSFGWDRQQYYRVPRLSLEQVLETYSRGNIVLIASDLGNCCQRQDANEIINRIISINKDDFYNVIYPINTPFYDALNDKSLQLTNSDLCKHAVFLPAYYKEIDDADLKDVAYLVVNNIKPDQSYRYRIPYQRDSAILESSTIDEKLSNYIDRTSLSISHPLKDIDALHEEILAKCTWRWKIMPIALPKMAENEPHELLEIAKKGFREKMEKLSFGSSIPKRELSKYIERLRYEMGVLTKLGFCGYFLMVRDLLNYAREQKIPVGPGRGSSAGSLVAWLVGITDVDPIRHGLLFERFINPERIDLPDADLDFSQARRQEAIRYLIDKYGENYVAGIRNYSYLGAPSALRDAGRIFGLSGSELDVSKQVGFAIRDGAIDDLSELRHSISSLDKFASKYSDVFNFACKLQNLMRNYGRHAAGVIVSGVPLNERAVVEQKDNESIICWDKRNCENMGLVKLDVLGLATLDLIDLAVKYVYESTGEEVKIDEIPLDEPKVLRNFIAGKTTGVFQLESSGMKKILKDLGSGVNPLTFESIVATTALFRPGPMQSGMLDEYIAVAKGFKSIESFHHVLDECTAETNGVILYQETTMKAVQLLAGFTIAEADKVRKAIGKKDLEKMHKMGELFMSQAVMGWVEVKLEDGSVMTLHKCSKHLCSDGEKHELDYIIENSLDVIEFNK